MHNDIIKQFFCSLYFVITYQQYFKYFKSYKCLNSLVESITMLKYGFNALLFFPIYYANLLLLYNFLKNVFACLLLLLYCGFNLKIVFSKN